MDLVDCLTVQPAPLRAPLGLDRWNSLSGPATEYKQSDGALSNAILAHRLVQKIAYPLKYIKTRILAMSEHGDCNITYLTHNIYSRQTVLREDVGRPRIRYTSKNVTCAPIQHQFTPKTMRHKNGHCMFACVHVTNKTFCELIAPT